MIEIGFRVVVLQQHGILHSVTNSDNFIRLFATVNIPIPIRCPNFCDCSSNLFLSGGVITFLSKSGIMLRHLSTGTTSSVTPGSQLRS